MPLPREGKEKSPLIESWLMLVEGGRVVDGQGLSVLSGRRRERGNPLAINAPFGAIENFGFGKEEAKGLASKERL